MLGREPDCLEPGVDSGTSSPESLAKWDPVTLSWRTLEPSLLEESTKFSGRWPTSGMMRNGLLYPRAPWVQHTHVKECSFWPTPTASSWGTAGATATVRARIADGTVTVREGQYMRNGQNGRKNPEWSESLMGLPLGWTEIETRPSATPSSPKLPNSSDADSSTSQEETNAQADI